MKHKRIVVSVLAFSLFAGGAAEVTTARSGFADRPLGRLLTGRFGRLLTLRSELNLTADQKEAIASALATHKAEIAKALQPVVEKARALRAATAAENIDEAKIHALADDLGKSIGDAAVVGAKVRHDVKQAANLSDEQAKRIADFHAQNQVAVDKFLSDAASAQ